MELWFEILVPYFLVIVRCFLSFLFLISSISKIREPHSFVKTVAAYRLLPEMVIRPFAFSLPWIELILGMVLLLGWETRLAAGATGVLYFLFSIALLINLLRGQKNLGCGCFGAKSNHKITSWLVFRDIGLMLAAVVISIYGGGGYSLETLPKEVQGYLLYQLGEFILPIALIGVGVFVFYKLMIQSFSLISLTTKE